jgi:hypothetical protein
VLAANRLRRAVRDQGDEEVSEEKRVSIYEYKPEHFGDTILEGVIVRDVHTLVIYSSCVPSSVVWKFWYPQCEKTAAYYAGHAGPWSDERQCIQGVKPPTRDEVMADIAKFTRALLAEGHLRADAFDEAV